MSASVRNSRRQEGCIVQLPGAVTELDTGLADVQVADLLYVVRRSVPEFRPASVEGRDWWDGGRSVVRDDSTYLSSHDGSLLQCCIKQTGNKGISWEGVLWELSGGNERSVVLGPLFWWGFTRVYLASAAH